MRLILRFAFEVNVEVAGALVGINRNAQAAMFDYRVQLRPAAAERRFSGDGGMQLHVHAGRLGLKHHAGLLAALKLVLLQASVEIVDKERL